MLATLLSFAGVNDAAAATPSKLAKQAALAEYLKTLDEADLRRAVRFAAGRAFASTDERVLNVGGRVASDVVLDLLHLDPGEFHRLVVRSGELGEALARVWPAALPGNHRGDAHPIWAPTPNESARATGLTLAEMAAAFDQLAATGNAARKRELLGGLLRRCADPREAAYLTKVIFGDLRTGVQEGVLQAAVAKAFGQTLAAVQQCQLLVGDLDEVAVLAKGGALESAAFRLFHPIQFMLANPQETPADVAATLAGRTFYCEDKLDGIRAQVHKSGDGAAARVAIYTRTMDRTDASFPDVVEAVRGLPGDFLLDGEIVPWRGGQVLPFAHIQKRLGRKTLSAKMLRDNPAVFIAFDILYKNGELLMGRPLRERRRALVETARYEVSPAIATITATPAPPLLITDPAEVSSEEQITLAFAAARDRRNEGIVLKDPESPYSPGRRGKIWLKLKTHLPTFDCVVTAAEHGHGKRRNSLSDYTFAVWDREPTEQDAKLVNIGKAYSGVTDEEIAQLTELFLGISRANNGRVHLVEPKIVLEIACDQIQESKRHASGFALRFPRIKRVRWDKGPQDADRLSRVAEIYQSVSNFAVRVAAAEPGPVGEATLFDGMD